MSHARAGDAAAPSWLLLAVPVAVALGLYGPLLPGLVHDWSSFPSLSHGFAIPLISAYLIWVRRDTLRATPLSPSVWGLPVLVLGLLALVVGIRGDESFVGRISLPVILFGLTIFLGGWAITRQVWVGIAYIALMVPLPWATLKLIMYRSRLWDAEISALALGWLGVPVYRDGVMLHLPNIVLEVADDCSSIPAIAALFALGVAYTSLGNRPTAVRALLVAATLPLAIFSNIVRITLTAVLVYYSGPWVLATVYHQLTGTTNFLLTFLALFLLDALLTRGARALRR